MKNMLFVIIGIVSLVLIGSIESADAYRLQIITATGAAWMAHDLEMEQQSIEEHQGSDSINAAAQNAINGMGLGARMININFDTATSIHGTGYIGNEFAVKPTQTVSDLTDFTVLITEENEQDSTDAVIPLSNVVYDWDNTYLDTNSGQLYLSSDAEMLITETYTFGTAHLTKTGDGGFNLIGPGTIIIKPNYNNIDLNIDDVIFSGTLEGGAIVNIIETTHNFTIDKNHLSTQTQIMQNDKIYNTSDFNGINIDDMYIEIILPNPTSEVNMKSFEYNANFIAIENLPPDVAWQIEWTNSYTTPDVMLSGVTDGYMTISENDFDSTVDIGVGVWKLRLFETANAYRGGFSTVIIDEHYDQNIHRPNPLYDDDGNERHEVYTVHTYVKSPMSASVTIANMTLLSRNVTELPNLELDYINGAYAQDSTLYVPVVPEYKGFGMNVDALYAEVLYADVLNPPSIQIAIPTTKSEITLNESGPILEALATTGTVAYYMATDSNVKVQIIMSIDGELQIENTYVGCKTTRNPPPPPRTWDPLEAWAEVWINGIKKQTTDDDNRIYLGKNEFPAETVLRLDYNDLNMAERDKLEDESPVTWSSCGVDDRFAIIDTVDYQYPTYPVIGAIEVNDLTAGDIVEFFIYAHVNGGIEEYMPPPDVVINHEYAIAEATVQIISASVALD